MDSQGLPPDVVVHTANIQDRDGAKLVISKIIGRFTNLRLNPGGRWIRGEAGVWVGEKAGVWVGEKAGCEIGIARRAKGERGFTVLPMRWAVERTFVCLGSFRRLSKAYEESPNTSETWIRIAMIHIMPRRLTA